MSAPSGIAEYRAAIDNGCVIEEALAAAFLVQLRAGGTLTAFVAPAALLYIARRAGQPIVSRGGHVCVRIYSAVGWVWIFEDVTLCGAEDAAWAAVRFGERPVPDEPTIEERLAKVETDLARAIQETRGAE